MIILEEFIWNEDHYAYHLTQKKNIEKIIKEGLLPLCKERSISKNDLKNAIYFFDRLSNVFDWAYYLYDNDNLQDLELLRFNLKNKKWFFHNNGEDFYLESKIFPTELEYLVNIKGITSEEDLDKKLVWTPITRYK